MTNNWLAMSELRDRIGRIFYRGVHGTDDAWDGLHPMLQGPYLEDADVLIRELGLRRENEGETDMEDTDPHPSGAHRYVTEWKTDE